ncbi:MAG: hypothetical protein ACREHV_05545, partial [Rhizomicrobium sp.]
MSSQDAFMDCPRSPTRAEKAISCITPGRMESLFLPGSRYAESTLKKHEWVQTIYVAFTDALSLNAWPLDQVIAAGFIRFLGMEAKYNFKTIEDVVVPSLKRMQIQKTGISVPTIISDAMSQALKDVKYSSDINTESHEKEPAIVPDVKRIIESMPDGHPAKAAESCLWLFALSTGARAITCSNVKISDLFKVSPSSKPGDVIIMCRLRVTKGNANWNQEVALEGNPDRCSPLNVVYWLELHLKSYGLSINTLHTWSARGLDKKLWVWTTGSMRERFKSRAVLAGFPPNLFGFHSLRSGFICSALLKAGSNQDLVQGILERTAIVGGWKAQQSAQMGYVKACAKRTIIASRLVLPLEENASVNVIDPIMMSSEAFHGITLVAPSWDVETNYKMFHVLFTKIIGVHYEDKVKQASYVQRLWRKAFNVYVLSDRLREAKAADLYVRKDRWTHPSTRQDTECRARCVVGRADIVERLHKDYSELQPLLELMKSFIQPDLDTFVPVREIQKRVRVEVVDQRPRDPTTNHRKRVTWTPEEDEILLRGKLVGETWKVIA